MKNIKDLDNRAEATRVNSSGGNINNNKNSTLPSLTHPVNSSPLPDSADAKVTLSQAQEDRFLELFTPSLVAEFESLVIERQICFEKSASRIRAVKVQWNKTKQIIARVGLKDPSEWEMNAQLFYFAEPIALSYFQSVLLFLNKFGKFVCHKNRHPYVPLKMPSNGFKQKMKERHTAAGGKDQASKPLTPALLGAAKRRLRLDHYNFLYITLWFGLRPSEVDRLKDSASWRLEELGGETFLSIYQAKLSHMPEAARWKSVLVWEPQQKVALALIKEGNFNRPLMTTMKRVFGAGVYLYAGRKGFGAVMMEKENSLADISKNLGHADIKTTKQFYVDAEAVRLADLRDRLALKKALK